MAVEKRPIEAVEGAGSVTRILAPLVMAVIAVVAHFVDIVG